METPVLNDLPMDPIHLDYFASIEWIYSLRKWFPCKVTFKSTSGNEEHIMIPDSKLFNVDDIIRNQNLPRDPFKMIQEIMGSGHACIEWDTAWMPPGGDNYWVPKKITLTSTNKVVIPEKEAFIFATMDDILKKKKLPTLPEANDQPIIHRVHFRRFKEFVQHFYNSRLSKNGMSGTIATANKADFHLLQRWIPQGKVVHVGRELDCSGRKFEEEYFASIEWMRYNGRWVPGILTFKTPYDGKIFVIPKPESLKYFTKDDILQNQKLPYTPLEIIQAISESDNKNVHKVDMDKWNEDFMVDFFKKNLKKPETIVVLDKADFHYLDKCLVPVVFCGLHLDTDAMYTEYMSGRHFANMDAVDTNSVPADDLQMMNLEATPEAV